MTENSTARNKTNFFDQGSPFLSHPALTTERTKAEVDFAITKLELRPGDKVLDVGCGFGRHSIELARRGFEVVGLDPSAVMLGRAKVMAAKAEVKVDFHLTMAEDFVSDDRFDGAICLMTTLGQINDGKDNLGLTHRVYDALGGGKRFLVELPQKGPSIDLIVEADTFQVKDQITEVRRSYDDSSRSMTETFGVVTTGETSQFILRYRLFDWPELSRLLEKAGFKDLEAFADINGAPLLPESINMWCVGEK